MICGLNLNKWIELLLLYYQVEMETTTIMLVCGCLCSWIQTKVHAYGYPGLAGIGNFTVTQLHSRAANLEWGFNISAELSGFEIVVKPLRKVHYHHHKVGPGVPRGAQHTAEDMNKIKRVYKVHDLMPGTEYELFIYALGKDGVVGASERIIFRTLTGSDDKVGKFRADPFECFIVVSILIAWGVAFGVFVHKWGTIRIIQPGDYRPNLVDPKNLENIKIVKKPTDSVIYRNYSQKYTSTMQAREKKIERMNTMPNIKVAQEEMIAMEHMSPSSSPKIARFRDTFLQPEGSPKASSSLSSWIKSSTPSFGTFHMNKNKDVEGLKVAASTSYLDQLRHTALLMMDVDINSQKQRINRSSPEFHVHSQQQDKQQDLSNIESDGLQMVPLMRVEEEDEDSQSDVTKSPRYSSRQNLLNERENSDKSSKQKRKDSFSKGKGMTDTI